MRFAQAGIGLAVSGRPIGPWSRRTGAPEASATRRDRSPRCSRDCSRDGTRPPGMSENRTGRGFGIRPARRPGRDLRAPANTPRRQFRSRCPRTWGFESPRSHTLLTRSFALHLLSPARGRTVGCQRLVNGTRRLLLTVAQDQPRHRPGGLGVQAGEDVAVGVHGDGDAGVPEPLGDDLGRYSAEPTTASPWTRSKRRAAGPLRVGSGSA